MKHTIENFNLPEDITDLLQKAPTVQIASSISALKNLSCGGMNNKEWTVSHKLPDGRIVDEAQVVRVKNGFSANYTETYMRRADPDCMFIADENLSDKTRFEEQFGYSFKDVRQETFNWLVTQDLAVFAFEMGQPGLGGDAVAICPANSGFFAFGLGLLQGIGAIQAVVRPFNPAMILYVAPPFRHTHFDKKVVVHRRVGNRLHASVARQRLPRPSRSCPVSVRSTGPFSLSFTRLCFG